MSGSTPPAGGSAGPQRKQAQGAGGAGAWLLEPGTELLLFRLMGRGYACLRENVRVVVDVGTRQGPVGFLVDDVERVVEFDPETARVTSSRFAGGYVTATVELEGESWLLVDWDEVPLPQASARPPPPPTGEPGEPLLFLTYALDEVEQGQRGERLGEVDVGPGRQAALPVALLRLGGQHHHHGAAGARVGLDRAAHVEAVQPRHHDVEQHQARVLGAHQLQRLHAVAGLDDLVVVAFEGGVHQRADRRLVVGDQELHRRPSPASSPLPGRVKLNSEPEPDHDSAQMRRASRPGVW